MPSPTGNTSTMPQVAILTALRGGSASSDELTLLMELDAELVALLLSDLERRDLVRLALSVTEGRAALSWREVAALLPDRRQLDE